MTGRHAPLEERFWRRASAVQPTETPPRGSAHPLARTDEATIAEGKQRHREGTDTITAIARDLGISRKTLSRAINGQTWPHVP